MSNVKIINIHRYGYQEAVAMAAAERVGRAALHAGMSWCEGMQNFGAHSNGTPGRLVSIGDSAWSDGMDLWHEPTEGEVPDFRDRLTEKACELWVEDVSREVYGCAATVRFMEVGGGWSISVRHHAGPGLTRGEAPTLAEACIAAVRAMKDGERQ